MKYIDADRLRKEIEHRIDILADVSIKCAKNDDIEMHNYYHGKAISLDELLSFIDSLQQEQPETFDSAAFQKGVQEGRRLEREDVLTVADIEKLHTFLYAVKNNKQGAFTFTRLSDEQYEEVLQRFNNAKEENNGQSF